MASIRITDMLQLIITKQEGGYVVSRDADGGDGGWTFAGMTKNSFVAFNEERYKITTYEDIKECVQGKSSSLYSLLISDLHDIYMTHYLPTSIAALEDTFVIPFLSCSINCGLEEAIKILQTALNVPNARTVKVDGVLGDQTFIAINALQPDHLFTSFIFEWAVHYFKIIQANPAKAQFFDGWMNRIWLWL